MNNQIFNNTYLFFSLQVQSYILHNKKQKPSNSCIILIILLLHQHIQLLLHLDHPSTTLTWSSLIKSELSCPSAGTSCVHLSSIGNEHVGLNTLSTDPDHPQSLLFGPYSRYSYGVHGDIVVDHKLNLICQCSKICG